MQRHYSTVSELEQAEGLAKVLRMMDFRDRQTSVGASPSEAPGTTKADLG
jgi:hypothetical protein